jgi:hypothetical protein
LLECPSEASLASPPSVAPAAARGVVGIVKRSEIACNTRTHEMILQANISKNGHTGTENVNPHQFCGRLLLTFYWSIKPHGWP